MMARRFYKDKPPSWVNDVAFCSSVVANAEAFARMLSDMELSASRSRSAASFHWVMSSPKATLAFPFHAPATPSTCLVGVEVLLGLDH